jgi:hypothetical protein
LRATCAAWASAAGTTTRTTAWRGEPEVEEEERAGEGEEVHQAHLHQVHQDYQVHQVQHH